MKKLVFVFTLLLSLSLLYSCTTENKNLDEIYDLKVEVEYSRELTNNEYLELLDNALLVEENNKYGTITWHNFNSKNETTKFYYDYRGNLKDYKAFYNYNNEDHLYFKDGYAYIKYGSNKSKSKIATIYDTFSVEEFKQEFMYKSSDYMTPYMIIDLLNETYETVNQEIKFIGIDKRNNYIVNAKVNGDNSRFVFNEKYELIYISVYDVKDNSTYCIYEHDVPSIEFPSFSDYEYTE